MEQNQYIVALEIGSSKIVGAIAEKSPSGLVSVNYLSQEKLTNIVRYGCVQNVENLKSSINRILKDLEQMVNGRITQAYVGISGRSLHSVESEVSRGLDSSKPITKEVIDQVISEAGKAPTNKNYQIIDIVPRAYYVDRSETTNPVGQFGSSIKVRVNQIIAKNTLKLNLDRVMSFGVGVKDYIVTPLAVAKQILTESELSLGCMLVDIGAETTTISIYKEGAPVYLNTLPLGGRNITRDIMNGLSVLEDTAERIKKNINSPLDPTNVDSIVIEGVKASDAANYITARTGEIIANINKQISNASLLAQDIHNLVLIGGGAQLQGIAALIKEKLGIDVRMGQAPKTVNILNHNINRPENVEVLALLAEAAEQIEPRETCVERDDIGDWVAGPKKPEPKPDDTSTEGKKEKPGKKGGRGGLLDTLRKKLGQLMTEDDEEEQ